MKGLFLDTAGGIAGDMFLAALCGLGLEVSPLEKALREAGLDVSVRCVERKVKAMAGTGLVIEFPEAQPLRHLKDLCDIAERLNVSDSVRQRSCAAFGKLAEVEAGVHGMSISEVHFHEVGAIDTVVDIVGAFWGVEQMGLDVIVCSPLPWFRGSVTCSHGTLPLPAPAAATLMQGKPVYPTEVEAEIITPTGALIVDQLVDRFVSGPEGRVLNMSTGYGDYVIENHVNGLRAVLYEAEEVRPASGPHSHH